jgi:hypothetical protein
MALLQSCFFSAHAVAELKKPAVCRHYYTLHDTIKKTEEGPLQGPPPGSTLYATIPTYAHRYSYSYICRTGSTLLCIIPRLAVRGLGNIYAVTALHINLGLSPRLLLFLGAFSSTHLNALGGTIRSGQ